jgi:iron-sulfur cluster repair protein YtfE (RIC family)
MKSCPTSFDLTALLDDIAGTHHQVLRRDAVRIEAFTASMPPSDVREDRIVSEMTQIARGLAVCVKTELEREENVFFPMLLRLVEQTSISARRAGMIRSRVMIAERELARVRGVVVRLAELAEAHLSAGGTCEICHELLGVLRPLMVDLREHTRKESEVLFPWAIERERALIR